MLERYFPESNFAALLFDFDGTIADTMGAHFESWNKALSVYKLAITREQHLAWAGQPTREIVRILNELHVANINYDDLSKQKETSYMSSLSRVKEILPVTEIIRHYHGRLPMAIVSGSRHRPVETTLKQLGLAKYFDAVICAEDYKNGKPAPDGFLQAAALLKVKPENCLVFEDAELGIQSAHNAGMTCLRVNERSDKGHDLVRVERK